MEEFRDRSTKAASATLASQTAIVNVKIIITPNMLEFINGSITIPKINIKRIISNHNRIINTCFLYKNKFIKVIKIINIKYWLVNIGYRIGSIVNLQN